MSARRVDVLAVMDEQHEDFIRAGNYTGEGCWFGTSTEACVKQDYALVRDAVRELVEADREYDDARKDWDDATSEGADLLSDDDWRRIADRYEAAIMRRIAALERFGG